MSKRRRRAQTVAPSSVPRLAASAPWSRVELPPPWAAASASATVVAKAAWPARPGRRAGGEDQCVGRRSARAAHSSLQRPWPRASVQGRAAVPAQVTASLASTRIPHSDRRTPPSQQPARGTELVLSRTKASAWTQAGECGWVERPSRSLPQL